MEMVVVDAAGAPKRLVLTGRLDAAGTEKVEVAFSAQMRAARDSALVDMTGVTFVGSLGIRMLISGARLADRGGCKAVIFGVQPAVAEVFRTIALDDLIPVVPDEAAALAHLAA
ncbi:STAS domain-containing protein [Roseomonas sp. CAU 1739]|uniref:STAS domain-containing protein n=1 Tax=Roseomonas sp. CAU 1739 TaxID=3140364 RepID=UPI00325B65F0